MTHSRVKGNLLNWYNSFVGKKQKTLGGLLPCACFRPYRRKEIGSFLMTSDGWTKQSNKISFCLFCGIGPSIIENHSTSMVGFVN